MNMFNCVNSLQYIPSEAVCDMKFDWAHLSDKWGCSCHNYLFNCETSKICNSFSDYQDWSNKLSCKMCSASEFKCSYNASLKTKEVTESLTAA